MNHLPAIRELLSSSELTYIPYEFAVAFPAPFLRTWTTYLTPHILQLIRTRRETHPHVMSMATLLYHCYASFIHCHCIDTDYEFIILPHD